MGKYDKLRARILEGGSDANIKFDDLCRLLQEYGFEQRVSGSHHLFRSESIIERPNLQRDGSKAKVYQVRQIRQIILRYHLGEGKDEDQESEA